MSLKDWFAAKRRSKQTPSDTIDISTASTPAGSGLAHESGKASRGPITELVSEETLCKLWTTCYQCKTTLPTRQLSDALHVCPSCGYHFRVDARDRIAQLTDRFDEMDADLRPADPLEFSDTQPYRKRQRDAHEKSNLNEAVITGLATIADEPCGLAVMAFEYMGGSMGSVVGEKLTRLMERCLALHLPVVIITASGGARMQEGMFSLMQMVKTGAVMARLHEAGLLSLGVVSEPTFGGVTASFGMLGDILIAEEGARVGFAGRRVIEQTIRQKLPPDFQTAGYLLKYGQVDMVVKRPELKSTLGNLLRLHRLSRAEALLNKGLVG
ncbi:MAG: acetyl-CoA carboxylase, carboxyltransferase subunit beta [Vampirovibrionales bacterium]|nr:acetyl-CoA carboxylase, carboxyltransferase subunit beta [Vampirovibrionales bacterium]